jgi:hypothetical protein
MLPLFGPHLDNRVAYVGPVVDGMLQEYSSSRALRSALRRGRYDLLLVGRGVVPRDGSQAEQWTRQAGYEVVARSQLDLLLRKPGSCGHAGSGGQGCR